MCLKPHRLVTAPPVAPCGDALRDRLTVTVCKLPVAFLLFLPQSPPLSPSSTPIGPVLDHASPRWYHALESRQSSQSLHRFDTFPSHHLRCCHTFLRPPPPPLPSVIRAATEQCSHTGPPPCPHFALYGGLASPHP